MKRYEQMVEKYLKGNKKRTLATVMGVSFGALLIFAVFNITFCLIEKGLNNAEEVYKFDAVFYDLSEEQAETIENYPGVKITYGGSIRPKIFDLTGLVLVDDWEKNPYGIMLQEGRYPENSNEILVNVTLPSEVQIGDSVYFDPGILMSMDEPMEFVVTGTFVYEGDFRDISLYEYSYIDYLGILKEESYQQLKDSNAVFVKYDKQYRLADLSEDISKSVGADYILNDSIALYYNQTSNGSIQAVIAALILSLVVIIAMMAATVIKNTLRISVAERIRDYGVLRCAGASLKQLRKMLVWESLFIGCMSGACGIALSYVGMLIFSAASKEYNFKHFYLLAFFATLGTILITMLISTIEPSMILAKLTPVEAVRDQLKSVKKEKYKVRKARLVTKIFGVEGAYAYKNAMRNPRNFISRVFALTIGIILFICTEAICGTCLHVILTEIEGDRYYNVLLDPIMQEESYGSDGMPWEEYEAFHKNLDLAETELRMVEDAGDTVSTFFIIDGEYYTEAYNLDAVDPSPRFSEEYKACLDSYDSDWYKGICTSIYPAEDQNDEKLEIYSNYVASRTPRIYGYDAEVLLQLSDALIDGTCDPEKLGDDGIILYNTTYFSTYNMSTGVTLEGAVDTYSYQIGDKITFITAPYEEYNRRVQDMESYVFEQHLEESQEFGEETVRYRYMWLIRFKVFQDLYAEGYYKTYTIKGIVSDDLLVNEHYNVNAHYIMSKEQMKELFPINQDNTCLGMHADGYNRDIDTVLGKYGLECVYTEEIEVYKIFDNARNVCNLIITVVLIFMIINIFNTISSSMIFRKKEFALLRCVGMSKKKLTYMALLEGLLALLIAIVIGGVISSVSCYGIYRYFKEIWHGFDLSALYMSPVRICTALILLFAAMFFATWIPLYSIKKEIAPGLAEADE